MTGGSVTGWPVIDLSMIDLSMIGLPVTGWSATVPVPLAEVFKANFVLRILVKR